MGLMPFRYARVIMRRGGEVVDGGRKEEGEDKEEAAAAAREEEEDDGGGGGALEETCCGENGNAMDVIEDGVGGEVIAPLSWGLLVEALTENDPTSGGAEEKKGDGVVVCGPLSPPVRVEGRRLFKEEEDEMDASATEKDDPFWETTPKRRRTGRSFGGISSNGMLHFQRSLLE